MSAPALLSRLPLIEPPASRTKRPCVTTHVAPQDPSSGVVVHKEEGALVPTTCHRPTPLIHLPFGPPKMARRVHRALINIGVRPGYVLPSCHVTRTPSVSPSASPAARYASQHAPTPQTRLFASPVGLSFHPSRPQAHIRGYNPRIEFPGSARLAPGEWLHLESALQRSLDEQGFQIQTHPPRPATR